MEITTPALLFGGIADAGEQAGSVDTGKIVCVYRLLPNFLKFWDKLLVNCGKSSLAHG